MAMHLVIYVKDGQVLSVLSDFQGEMQCLVVSANDDATLQIKGEPWVKPMDFPEADGQQAVLQPVTVAFDPERVRQIFCLGDASKHALLKLLS